MKFSNREKYIGYGTAAVIGLLLLDSALLSPLFARLNDADGRVAKSSQELMASDQLFQNSNRARRKWKEMAGNSVKTDASSAESQLLNSARQWAGAAGLSVMSLKPGKADKERGFEKAVMQIAGTGTMEQVSRFMYAVETARIPVRIGDLQMNSRKEGTDDLSVQITLTSIFEPPAPAPDATGKAGGR
jgi:hypothetical protein